MIPVLRRPVRDCDPRGLTLLGSSGKPQFAFCEAQFYLVCKAGR